MIYREYETNNNYEDKPEYRITVSTDSFGAYSAMKSAIEMLAEQAEMPKGYKYEDGELE